MLLHILLASPLAAALLMATTSGRDGRSALRTAGLLAAGILLLSLPLLGGVAATTPIGWFTLPGTQAMAQYALSADGVASWMVVLSALLTVSTLLVSGSVAGERFREYAIWVFLLEAALFGCFLAADAVLFFVFFEALVAPAAFLIAGFGGPNRRHAALLFTLFTLLGSAPLAIAVWCLAAWTGSTDPAVIATATAGFDGRVAAMLFFGVATAFAVKTPLVPLHGWQAESYAEAPAPLGALLSGAMAKVGLYGFLRWTIPLFEREANHYALWFIGLGLLTLLYGALVAWRQDEIRRVVAFSSLSHLGLAVAGLFAFQETAFAGVVALMVAHGLSAGAIFLLAQLPEDWGKSRLLSSFGGMAASSPVFSVIFLAACMASVAVPGSLGFVGEFLILQGLWSNAAFLAIIGGLGAILSAVYTLRMIQMLLFGKSLAARRAAEAEHGAHGTPAFQGGKEISWTEAVAIVPLVILLFALGVHPGPVLDSAKPIEKPATAIASLLEDR